MQRGTGAERPADRRSRRAKPSLFAPVLGALLAAAGLFGLLAVLDIYDIDVAVGLAAGVLIVGAAIAVGAMTQRRVGGLVFLGLILLGAFGVAAATPVSVSSGVGEKTERPESVVGARPELRARHRRAQPRSRRGLAARPAPPPSTPTSASGIS